MRSIEKQYLQKTRFYRTRKVLGLCLGFGAAFCCIIGIGNAISNKIGSLNWDGYPTDDAVGMYLLLALCAAIIGAFAYPSGKNPKKRNRYKKGKTTSLGSIVL